MHRYTSSTLVAIVLAVVLAAIAHVRLQAQTTRTVCASGCDFTGIQAAVNASSLGDTIRVRAGETFTGTITLPVKAGSSYLTIRSDTADANLPPAGVRITPEHLPFLPRLVSSGSGAPTITAAEGAHHYRLIGLYFPSTPGGFNDVIRLGSNACDSSGYQEFEADQPTDIELDRIWIKADAVTGQKTGVTLGGRRMNVLNSRIEGIAAVGQDSVAVYGGNGSGPYRIENNFLEASTENILFGGADPCQRTVMTVTGTPTTTSANVSVSAHFASPNPHTLAELSVGQLVAIMTNGGLQRRHTIIRSITGTGATGSITYDPISDVPDVPGDIRGGVQASNITVRRNLITKQLRWRNAIIDSVVSASATAETASGTLAAGTYQYSVVAINTNCYANITCYSGPQVVTATLNATGRVKIDWQASPTATHYRIYGRTSAVTTYFQVAASVLTYTDTGAAGTSATSVPARTKWQIKTLFELKTGTNVQVDSNIFEYHWLGSGSGGSIWIKVTNQGCSHEWGQTRDVVIEKNLFQHIDGWALFNATEYSGCPNASSRPTNLTNITLRNNLVIDSTTDWADGGSGVYAIIASSYPQGKMVNWTVEHNTIGHYMRGLIQFSNTTRDENLILRNNMMRNSTNGIANANGGGSGTLGLDASAKPYTVQNNTIAGAAASTYANTGVNGTITGNFFPSAATWEATFENFTINGDPDADGPANYALKSDSPYKNAGTDGADLGANIPELLAAIEGVREGGTTASPSAPTITTTSPLAAGTVGTAYSVTLQALGTGTLTWALQAGTLPTGLSLSSAGVISGTPTTAQTRTFTVRVTDATTSLTADQILALTINASYITPTITTTTLANATQSVPYGPVTLASINGLAPVVWTVSAGTLPAGITLDAATGVLSGTPSNAGANTFTLLVTDALNGTDTQAFSLTVGAVSLPCGRPIRLNGQMIYTFKGPNLPSVAPPDCAAVNDFWIDSSTNPAVVKLITGTAGGVVTTTAVGSITSADLLSSSHSDTVASTPVEGAIIVGADDGSGNAKWQMLAPGPSGSFLGSDGASLGFFQPASALQRSTSLTFHARSGSAPTTWTDQPLAVSGFLGTVNQNIVPFVITGYTKVALYVRTVGPAVAGATMWLEYSTDSQATGTWTPIDGVGGTGTSIPIDVNGHATSSTATVASGLNGMVYLRIAAKGGNGVVDPTFGNIAAVFW